MDDFRRAALRLPGAEEGSHFHHPDFRAGGRIFASIPDEKGEYGVLLLSPEDQAGMVADAPGMFSPVPGGWGRNGSTRVHLAAVTADVLDSALRAAWQRRIAMNEKPAKKKAAPRKSAKAAKPRK